MKTTADVPEGPFKLGHTVVHGDCFPAMTFAEMLETSGIDRRIS